jgi:hypothetical protein
MRSETALSQRERHTPEERDVVVVVEGGGEVEAAEVAVAGKRAAAVEPVTAIGGGSTR